MKTLKLGLFPLVLFVLISNYLQAQEYFYYYKGEKQVLELNTEVAYMTTKATLNSKTHLSNTLNSRANVVKFAQDNIYKTINVLNKEGRDVNIFGAEINMDEKLTPEAYFDRLGEISQLDNVTSVSPYFKNKRGDNVGLSNYFYVKLRQENDSDILYQKANENNITVIGNNRYMPLWYTLSCDKTSSMNAMQAANHFYETGLFQYAEPDLMGAIKHSCANDPDFDEQWALKNTGQDDGTSGIDINVCDAWDVTKGSSDIIVAVLDEGIYAHPDLANNLSDLSYNLETNSSPADIYGDHGVKCAGIIGAEQNNGEGGSGVAPNTTLMSLSRNFSTTSNGKQKYADAFNWTIDKNVSVISNSWGGGDPSDFLDDAIDNVLQNGRNGLGTVIVFSSGNYNKDVVDYPGNADNSGIITVGAIDNCGIRVDPPEGESCENWSKPGSNFGTHLDIVAPGAIIHTTDIDFYSDGSVSNTDDYSSFGGTSAACPHVSGVAALVLAVNSQLTQAEVVDIIEQSAQKLDNYSFANTSGRPNGTWNEEVGYGLLDAHAAVLLAESTLGNADCGSTQTFQTQIRGKYHDAEERITDGWMYRTSTDLEFGRDYSMEQHIGLRFKDINIPQGAEICNAHIEFRARGNTSSNFTVEIMGQDEEDAHAFQSYDHDISDRIQNRTSAGVDWYFGNPWTSNQVVESPDVASIVQEIVNRSDWNSGKHMAFLFETKSGIGTRRVYSYDGSKTKSAKLIIEYASGSGMGKLEVSLDEMKVYPNPSAANSEFYVELAENMIGQPVQVDLYNTNGQLMFTQEFEQANNILTVPTKNMQSGVYFIQVQSKDYHKTFNIMIGQ